MAMSPKQAADLAALAAYEASEAAMYQTAQAQVAAGEASWGGSGVQPIPAGDMVEQYTSGQITAYKQTGLQLVPQTLPTRPMTMAPTVVEPSIDTEWSPMGGQYVDEWGTYGQPAAAASGLEAGSTVADQPQAFPLLAAGAAVAIPLLGRVISLGLIRQIIARFGPVAVKLAIGALAFNEIMDLIGLGAPDGMLFEFGKKKKKRRRYSIGANPRVQTLAKVSRHCKRLLKRHEKVSREFLPKKTTYGQLPRTMLSAVERKALKG